MSIADLIGDRLRTVSGAEVEAPTVRQFFRALRAFGPEIGIIRTAARGVKGVLDVDLALALFTDAPEDGRLRYVLGTDDLGVARAVARAVVPLAKRIDELLGTPGDEPGAGGEETSDVDSGTLLVFGCAERFKIDPTAVMNWPLGVFLDCLVAFSKSPSTGDDDEIVGGVVAPSDVPAAPPVSGPINGL